MFIRVLSESADGCLSHIILLLKLNCSFHFLVLEILDKVLLLLDSWDLDRLIYIRFGLLKVWYASLNTVWTIRRGDFLF